MTLLNSNTTFHTFLVTTALALITTAWAADPSPGDQTPWRVVHPVDTGVALANPGMGWVFHHYDTIQRLWLSRSVQSAPSFSKWAITTTRRKLRRGRRANVTGRRWRITSGFSRAALTVTATSLPCE
jgi:hypothetical protein